MTEPVPIVARAEVECSLPGLAAFVKGLVAPIKKAREKNAEAHTHGWQVARAIYEYANRSEVQTALKAINHQPDGRVRPGRPKTAHRLAIDELVRQGLVNDRTVRRWVYEWYTPAEEEGEPRGVSIKLELKPDCAEKDLFGTVAQNSSRLADWVEGLLKDTEEDTAAAVERDIPSPRELADAVANKLEKVFFRNGHPILRTRAQKDAFSKRLNQLFAQMNLEWELMPHERH